MTKIEDDMDKSYKTASRLLQVQFTQSPELAQQFGQLEKLVPIVVKGQHDHIEQIFQALDLRYEPATLDTLSNVNPAPERPIFINCSSSEPNRKTITLLNEHAHNGGIVITTDWCLHHIVEKAFPDYIRWTKTKTCSSDESFPVEFILDDLKEKHHDLTPSWFVENSSYPLEILKGDEVKVLFQSLEFGKKYKCNSALAVGFPVGKGGVIHYVSHLYAQMVELRGAKDAQASCNFAQDMGVDPSALGDLGNQTSAGSVKAAYSTILTAVKSGTFDFGKKGKAGVPATEAKMAASKVGSGDRFKLTAEEPILYHGTEKKKYEVDLGPLERELILGRFPECDVSVLHSSVSRRHAALYPVNSHIELRDLGSKNYTFINGARITSPAPISYGDRISFGPECSLRVQHCG